ncbi:MAG: CusA/CzcA family heavy metal efflux RND transporter, partial [Chitinophagaceae bacterium]|nr:CusA/CzcA family heavy metal efflux RND transporter [Chitinophagaceae bacterium]
PMPIDASDMMVILKDKKEWTSAKTFDELTEKMSKELEAVPGVTFGFQFPVQMRFNELMTGARQDVVCKIFGDNLDTLAILAKKLGDVATTVQGARDLYVETVTGMPQIVIQYNRAAIAQYGLNVSDINRVVNAAFAGQISGKVYEGEKRFDLVVRLGKGQRKDLADVQNLLIPTAQGTQIPLNQVAKVDIQEGPNQIQREDAQRRIVIGFNVRGRDVQSMVTELQQKVQQQMKLPPGYHMTYGGAFENLQAAKKRLSIAVPVSLFLIFLMLYFAFRSVRQGLLIYSAIPLSAIGGILALAIRGMPFSISAGIGFIALFGVAVLNGIVLIAEFNRLRNEENVQDIKVIVLQGTQARLRPVLMTALVASLGFLPMALSNGAGAEVQRPLATVVIGGLLIATFLTLFVLPTLYIMFEKKSFMKNKANIALSTVVLIVLLLGNNKTSAQQPISMQAAIDTALKNNLSLRSEQLQADQLKQLRGTAADIPQTMITADVGQINSYYTDTKFSVSQNIRFPTVYARQKSVLNQEWKVGVLNVALKERDLKKRVSQVFYEMLYLQQKQQLLQHADSLYANFLKTAELRFSAGESNILEKTTAQAQRGQVGQQLRQAQQDYSVLQTQLKWLLNSFTDFIPQENAFKMAAPMFADTLVNGRHPYLKYLFQEREVSAAKLQLEKAKLAPDLFVAYNNTSIRGTGADNKTYGAAMRFNAAQVGVGIPLFAAAQKSRIGAARINQRLSENNYAAGVQSLQSQFYQALQEYNKQLQAVNYYEVTALKNVDTILSTSNQQFLGGDINYLEWVLLTNQAITIQSEYLDAVRGLNQSVINLQTFINN